jgi:hypothetical protein
MLSALACRTGPISAPTQSKITTLMLLRLFILRPLSMPRFASRRRAAHPNPAPSGITASIRIGYDGGMTFE